MRRVLESERLLGAVAPGEYELEPAVRRAIHRRNLDGAGAVAAHIGPELTRVFTGCGCSALVDVAQLQLLRESHQLGTEPSRSSLFGVGMRRQAGGREESSFSTRARDQSVCRRARLERGV